MKRKIIFILFFIINIICLAASYDIRALHINGELKKDGSMQVVEQVVYDIGEINGILFDIDAKDFGGITSLAVYEDINNGKNFREVDRSNYEVTENNGLYKIKLYSKNYNNSRIFAFAYTLPKAITMYNDVAQFNRKVVGQNWQQPIDEIYAKISLPAPEKYDNEKILAFGHGQLTGNVDKEKNSVIYTMKYYYPGDFVEAHILMDTDIFSEVSGSQIINKNMRNELLTMEKELAEKANLEREEALKREEQLNKLRKYDKTIFGIEIGLILSLLTYVKIFFKRENKIKNEYGKYLREIPDNYSPALAGTIMSDIPNNEEILATLVDLIRRKILTLETQGNYNIISLSNSENQESLTDQEKIILDIYINDLGNGKSLVLENINRNDISTEVARKFTVWQNKIFFEMEKKDLKKERMKGFKKVVLILIALLFFISPVFQIAIFENPIFLPVSFLSFILLGTTLSATRENTNLQKTKQRWTAFKNFLSDYSQLEEARITSVHLWEHYFVYAIALGVSEKVVKAYKKALDMGRITNINQDMNLGRMTLFDIYSRQMMFNSLNNLSRSTYSRATQKIFETRKSSSIGRGGGFSSGSSGGGGSRGGGGAF